MAEVLETGTLERITVSDEASDDNPVTFGSQDRGDDYSLDEDDLTPEVTDDGITIEPPLSQLAKGFIPIKAGMDGFSFSAYSMIDLAGMASPIEIESIIDGVAGVSGPTVTYKRVRVRVTGFGDIVFDRVKIGRGKLSIGVKKLGKYTFTCKVYQTTAYPCGYYYEQTAASGSGS